MKYTPKSENQLKENNMWPEGEYGFEVLDQTAFGSTVIRTEETQSRAGNDMLVVVLRVYNDEGRHKNIVDYIIPDGPMEFKLRHIADCCSVLDKYDSGKLSASDLIGKQGFVILKQGKGTDKYPAKNEVKDYVVGKGKPSNIPSEEDEIQF